MGYEKFKFSSVFSTRIQTKKNIIEERFTRCLIGEEERCRVEKKIKI